MRQQPISKVKVILAGKPDDVMSFITLALSEGLLAEFSVIESDEPVKRSAHSRNGTAAFSVNDRVAVRYNNASHGLKAGTRGRVREIEPFRTGYRVLFAWSDEAGSHECQIGESQLRLLNPGE